MAYGKQMITFTYKDHALAFTCDLDAHHASTYILVLQTMQVMNG